MPDDPIDPTTDESSNDQHDDEARERGGVDPDSPGRSLIEDGDEIVEPNEPA